MREPLIIANASGFYGDRLSAPEEILRGGPIHVLTGDYLAELTMAILHRARLRDGRLGYATTFLAQLERILGECLDRGVRVVTNAGGLNPRGLVAAIEALAARLGLAPRVAVVEGDDLAPRIGELLAAGEPLAHMDRGTPLREGEGEVVAANAYLGGWGIREALARGADVVVCGRVADAALVVGPAAHWFGWQRDDWDRLAGAAAAGHILECGTQATGGNYAFFEEVPSFERVGFPLAEIREDGSAVITKHPGTGGLVSVGTVTAQLVYEIDGPRYITPDVIARFDALSLCQEGPDRVLVAGARGEPPPPTAKVAVLRARGFRGSVTVLLAGLDVEAKAALLEAQLFAAPGGKGRFSSVEARLVRRPRADPTNNEDALGELRITVTSPDAEEVGRRFSARVVELALASAPGITLTAPPGDATPELVLWPCLVAGARVREVVRLGGEEIPIEPHQLSRARGAEGGPGAPEEESAATVHGSARVRVPLGRAFGARSGDKGGNASLGVWARTPEAYAFLRAYLTTDRLKALLPETAPLPVDRHELPNLLALSFVIRGLLEGGAAGSTRVDPQAKTLAEYLRARVAEVPVTIVMGSARAGA